jgi:predicted dinucleotide-binding enzyme
MSIPPSPRRLGIIGAGKLGTALARAALASGYDVVIAGSGAPERIRLIVEVLAPGARVTTTDDVVKESDVIVLAVPAHRFRELERHTFDGKILIDTMNYWEPTDGVIEELATAPSGTSVVVQSWFATARVVKALNQLGYHDIDEGRRPRGSRERIAVAVAGDDRDAVEKVVQLIDDIGFDALHAGALREGVVLEPNGAAFGAALGVGELINVLWPAAKRA